MKAVGFLSLDYMLCNDVVSFKALITTHTVLVDLRMTSWLDPNMPH